jgi:hypothetical protein
MTTAANFILSLARKVCAPVREGIATGGSMKTLVDSELEFGGGQYEGGTLWILSGAYSGATRVIRRHNGDTFTFDPFASPICVPQVETATIIGSVTGSGNAVVTVTAAGMNNNPKTINVAVNLSDSASTVGDKIRIALAADEDVNEFFIVSGTGANVVLTARKAADNDTTMNISIANGTCTGLTAAPTSTNTTAGVAGPRYAVAENDTPRDVLFQAVNESLRKLASYYSEDTTLTTVANQLEYTLPAGVNDVLQVWIATETTAPYNEYRHTHWDLIPGKIRFAPTHAPAWDGYRIRLVYRGAHTDLSNDTDTLPFGIDEEALFWMAVNHVADVGLRTHHKDEKHNWADYKNEALEMLRRTRPRQQTIQRDPRHSDW